MRMILKMKWLIMAIWIAATVGLMLSAPAMEALVREKGQINVPEGYSSSIASKLAASIGNEDSDKELSTVLVFYKEGGLSDSDLAEVKRGIQLLKDTGDTYHITSVMTHFDTEELKAQMVSEDGSTVLALVKVSPGDQELVELREGLYTAIQYVSIDHYYTGGWIITEDILQSSQDGLKKTEFITVGFILIILVIVFRSVVAPFVPLLTVGFTYLASQSVVAYLVDYFDFPLSTFTQIFLVAVLFGIGTDYCILLISRFKEELMHRGDKTEAIIATYRTAGKTVLFSGLAVLVGFSSIGLSTFVLYRSAVAVAIGVVVLLVALFTIVPFFMAVLGNALFWPSKGSIEHKDSKLWGKVGSFSLKRPLGALLIIGVIAIPLLTAYKGSISFNSLDEIGNKYKSVQAFNLISDGFSAGESLPTSVIVKSEKRFDTSEGLGVLEQLSRELTKVNNVSVVRSATRPTGEILTQFLVADQVVTLENGLGQGSDGLSEIKSGLSDASSALSDNAPKLEEASQGAGKLVAGTNELKEGIKQLGEGLKSIEQGLIDGSVGAKELVAGLKQAQTSAKELATASEQLYATYSQLGSGLEELSKAYVTTATEQKNLAEALASVGQSLSGMSQKYPELESDEDYQKALATLLKLEQGAAAISGGLEQLNGQLALIVTGMDQANDGYLQASEGQAALADGLSALAVGIGELQKGIAKAADGQGQIVKKLPTVTDGLGSLENGQKELQSGFASLNEQINELTSGLDQSVDGLNQVTDGLASASGYLNNLAQSPDKQMTGWYIPEEAITSEQFQAALDVYMSEDRQTVKLDVIFASHPYKQETMVEIDELEAVTTRVLAGTEYGGATIAVGGVTSINHDLSNISDEDYSRTVVVILVSILIMLMILFRSMVMPIYMVASLYVTYYTSMAVTELIFVRMLGYTGISWAVPFFGFVMLMALGIDYSIFLMDRFKEYRHLSPVAAIHEAMKKMGTVIMSAAVILGGTFAAMLPSGVMSLLQIATLVLSGLFLYALVMLPLFIPVMVKLFGSANWWPFKSQSHKGSNDEHPIDLKS
ncbi:MAG: MMPL family transporter [Candidatus Cohnella colombiensis]|uniref:MMPL family transporter n=1 Tax=Candidatus Cohnella colombiensis TaxID=3121368 RepID=A0AA95EV63_9BACL|nr:MAG: MMPL family transporter [Cohnella sp.]